MHLTDYHRYKKSLGRSGPGAYTVPGLMKLVVQRKPATKARKGINPFTGEETMFIPSYHHLIAKVSGDLLAIVGQDITVTNALISSPKFSVSIIRGCDAIEPIALYVCAVLAFPSPFLKRLPGMIAGTLLLLILNLVRIVSLFLIGVYSPRIFALTHIDVWQALFIFLAVLLWILWLLWATRSQVLTRPASN